MRPKVEESRCCRDRCSLPWCWCNQGWQWLKKLKNSDRNCTVTAHAILKSLSAEKFVTISGRHGDECCAPLFPYVPAGTLDGATKAAVLKYCWIMSALFD